MIVAQLYRVLVDDFVELLLDGKHEEKNKGKKLVSDIGCNIFTESRIEPGDVSFPCLFGGFVVVKVVWVVACPISGRWGFVNFSSLVCPLSFTALLYVFVASSNNLESKELSDSLNSIPFGRVFMIASGWLLSLCMWLKQSLGFL